LSSLTEEQIGARAEAALGQIERVWLSGAAA
jgi:hypothetical protein